MEITLAWRSKGVVSIRCDGTHSHTFTLKEAMPERQGSQVVLTNPVETGQRLFAAVLRTNTPARSVRWRAARWAVSWQT